MSDESLIRQLVEAIDDADEAVIREILADEIDVVDDERSYSQDRVVEEIMALDAALSDIEYTIERLWDETDGAYALDIRVSGVFDDAYRFPNPTGEGERSVDPTGESVSGSAVYLLAVEDGEVVAMRSHGYTEMMLSMGVIEFTGEPVTEAADAEPGAEAEE